MALFEPYVPTSRESYGPAPIYGAGYWRKGRKIYEEQNKIYR